MLASCKSQHDWFIIFDLHVCNACYKALYESLPHPMLLCPVVRVDSHAELLSLGSPRRSLWFKSSWLKSIPGRQDEFPTVQDCMGYSSTSIHLESYIVRPHMRKSRQPCCFIFYTKLGVTGMFEAYLLNKNEDPESLMWLSLNMYWCNSKLL